MGDGFSREAFMTSLEPQPFIWWEELLDYVVHISLGKDWERKNKDRPNNNRMRIEVKVKMHLPTQENIRKL